MPKTGLLLMFNNYCRHQTNYRARTFASPINFYLAYTDNLLLKYFFKKENVLLAIAFMFHLTRKFPTKQLKFIF